VGSWIVQITFTSPLELEDVRKRGLAQFTVTGQWIGTESAVEPGSKVDGSWRQTLYLGKWTSTSDGEIEVKGKRMYKSEEGVLLVTTFTRIQLKLEPGRHGRVSSGPKLSTRQVLSRRSSWAFWTPGAWDKGPG
jgi:hypothetical protein